MNTHYTGEKLASWDDMANKKQNPKIFLAYIVVAALIVGLALVFTSPLNPFSSNPWSKLEWEMVPAGNSISLSREVPDIIANNTCVYFGYKIDAVKINGVALNPSDWAYETPLGVKAYASCEDPSRKALLICSGDNVIGKSFTIFKKDMASMQGKSIEIDYSYTSTFAWSAGTVDYSIWYPQACAASLFGVAKGTYSIS